MDADVTRPAGEFAPPRVEESSRVAVAGWRRVAAWVADYELVLLAIVVPILMSTNRMPRFLTVAALTLAPVGWLARKVALGYFTRRTPLDVPVVLLVSAASVSLYASVELGTSFIGFHKIIAEVVLFYGIVNGLHTHRAIRLFVRLFLLLGIAAAGASLFIMSFSPAKFPFLSSLYSHLPAMVPRFVNPNYVGGTVVLFVPLALSLFLVSPHLVGRFGSGMSFVVIGGTLVLTQSRSALMGAVVAFLLLAVWRNRWFLLGVPLLVVAGWVVVQQGGVEALIGPLAIMDTTVNTLQGRLELWQRAIYIIQDFPYTGISIGTFDPVVHTLYPLFLIAPGTTIYNAHNLYLHTAVEFGIPGLVAYIGLLVAFGLTAVSILRLPNVERGFRVIALGLVAGLVAHLIYGLASAIVVANKTGTFIWAAFGVLVVMQRLALESTRTGR